VNLLEARAAVKQYIADHWTATTVIYPNAQKSAPTNLLDAQPIWIGVEFIPMTPEEIGLGGTGKRFSDIEGKLWGHVFAPVKRGEDDAFAQASAFGDLFKMLPIGNLQFYGPQIEPRDDYGTDDGSWYRISVCIKWRLVGVV
jgi:hypothetical protein